MKKYKIRDEYKDIVKIKYLDKAWVKSDEGTFYMIGSNYDMDHKIPDVIFEEIIK